MNGRATIFTYHRIVGDKTRNLYKGYYDANIVTSEEIFNIQMKKIKSDYVVMSLQELVNSLAGIATLPLRGCVLTFDDGFHEAYDIIFPLLKKLYLPATFFISGDHIAGTGNVRWLDLYYHLLDNGTLQDMNTVISKICPVKLEERDTRAAFKSYLQKIPLVDKYIILSDLANALKVTVDRESLNNSLYLTASQIEEMAVSGITFGGHTMTHQVLSNLDNDSVSQEINLSLQRVRELTGQRTVSFAYPFGGEDSYTASIANIVRESGALCGCTSVPGINTVNTSLFELKRMQTELCLF